jgi:hypothetical protein
LVLLVVLIAGRRRKRPKLDDDAVLHRQFTDDEEDGESYAREMDADADIAHVVGELGEDDDTIVIRWGEGKNGDRPIYSQPIESIETNLSDDDMNNTDGHSCSSPSCKICAMKAEEGILHFTATPKSLNAPVSLSRDLRSYTSNDTVDL